MNEHDYTAVFRSRVAAHGDKRALVFLDEAGSSFTEIPLTYRELDEQARAVAVALRERLEPGDRALLLYAPGLEFVSAFLGTLMAGVIAVPSPVPDGRAKGMDRLAGIAEDAGVKTVLTQSSIAALVEPWAATLDDAPSVLVTDTVPLDAAQRWSAPHIDADTVAFLQYTSGSTSDPKGVIVTHGNLTHNEAEIQAVTHTHADTIVAGWLPQYHDMGLIGMILHPLWLGGTSVFMSPLTFIKRPVLWLEALHRYRANIGVAPNFAFDFVTRRITADAIADIDLSSITALLNGSEPVQADSIRRFTEFLAPRGLAPEAVMPVYGMAETTLLITGTRYRTLPELREVDPEELAANRISLAAPGTESRALVGSGRPHTLELAIVDPDSGAELPDGGVGEIWVRGESVAKGYWALPEKTKETFDAHVRGLGGWLRTGDLGAIFDGELFVTGRIKDMIILNGRNLYAHDIELSARGVHPALGVAAAFTSGVPERLILVQEVRPDLLGEQTPAELAAALRKAIREEYDAALSDVVLAPKGAVARTTSGKIRRVFMRELYEAGSIEAIEAVAR